MLELLFPLSITLAIEVPIYLLMKWKDLKLFTVASIANLVLNLFMNILLTTVMANESLFNYYLFLSLYEIGTTFAETIIITLICKIKFKNTLFHAFVANLSSLTVGILLNDANNLFITRIVLTIIFFSAFALVEVITIIHFVKTNKKENAIK